MKCAVVDCKTNNKCKKSEFSFYSFPKDEALLKKWVHFCHRSDEFNVKTARICMKHFTPDDVENNIQFEMGFCSKRTLKPGSIPSINENSVSSLISKERFNRMQGRNKKKFVASLLQESNQPNEFQEEFISSLEQDLNFQVPNECGNPLSVEKVKSSEENSNEEEFLIEDNRLFHNLLKVQEDIVKKEDTLITMPKTPQEYTPSEEEFQCHIQGDNTPCLYVEKAETLKKDVVRLRLEKFLLEKSEKLHTKKISALKKRLEKVEREKNNLEKNLSSIFTAGQVDKLKNGMKRKVWSDEEIGQALALYATSKKAYKMLFKQNFPIPAIRTIQRFLQRGSDSTPVLEDNEEEYFSSTATQLEGVRKEHSYFSTIEISRVDLPELIEEDSMSLPLS